MHQSKRLPYLLLLPSTALILAVIVYPLAYGTYLAFTNQGLPGSPTRFVGLLNFQDLADDDSFRHAALNSVAWPLYTVGGVLLVGFLLALLLAQGRNGNTLARGALLIPWAIPTTAVAIIFSWLYDPLLGTVNQIVMGLGGPRLLLLADPHSALGWAAVPVIWRSYPFVMLMLLAGLQSIRADLYEAAGVDGANAFQKFRYITVPMILPVLTLVTVLQFIWLFNHVDIIWVMTQGGPADATHTLATLAFYYAYKTFKYGYASAIGLIMLLVLVLSSFAFLALQRRRVAE